MNELKYTEDKHNFRLENPALHPTLTIGEVEIWAQAHQTSIILDSKEEAKKMAYKIMENSYSMLCIMGSEVSSEEGNWGLIFREYNMFRFMDWIENK